MTCEEMDFIETWKRSSVEVKRSLILTWDQMGEISMIIY